jgi:hypothetical protein
MYLKRMLCGLILVCFAAVGCEGSNPPAIPAAKPTMMPPKESEAGKGKGGTAPHEKDQ